MSNFKIQFIVQRLHSKRPNSVSFCKSDQVPSGHYSQTLGLLLHLDIIDHIFIPNYLCDQLNSCQILCDDQDNMSDHLAVSANIGMKVTVPNFNKELNSLPKLKAYPRANWKDINFRNNYQHTVELSMQNIPLLDEKNVNKSNALAAVTSYYETLCDAIHLCVASCAAQTKPSGKRKHWWNHNCSKSRDRNRLFHHIWKSCGRISSGAVFDCYRDSRKAYRRACRQAVNSRSKYTANLISQLHRERNQCRLWNVIKHRKPSQQPQDNIGIHKLVDFFTLKFGYSPSESTCIHDANQEVSRKYKVLAEQSLSGFTECHVTEQWTLYLTDCGFFYTKAIPACAYKSNGSHI